MPTTFEVVVEVGFVPPALKEMLIVAQQVLNGEVPTFGPGGLQRVAEVAELGQLVRFVVAVVVGIVRPKVSVQPDPCEFVYGVRRFPFGSSIFVTPQVEK